MTELEGLTGIDPATCDSTECHVPDRWEPASGIELAIIAAGLFVTILTLVILE